MKNYKKFEYKIYLILFPLLFLILIEGYLCRLRIPSFGVKYAFCKESFFYNFWLENGFVEILQVILLILSIIYILKSYNKILEKKFISIFLIFKVLALFYYLGEEISWGQHFFNWSSPEWFLKNNNQNETNLHNITNLLDQLPRSLVLVWCTLIPISTFFLKKFRNFKNEFLIVIIPSNKLLYLSIIILFFVLPDLLVDKFNINTFEGNIISKELSYQLDIYTFNFLRLSELHELLFCYYFFLYSIYLNNFRYNPH